ncbi:D-alanine--D-alanine ligase [Alphaproteobacteria bacterium]|nr:D-alanine--D-alanine ligase [Alphaproteobacteria bacterium]
MNTLPKIGMLYGGWSSEAEVSKASAAFCTIAAREYGYEVVEIELNRNLSESLKHHKIDVVFNALHGQVGEDGSVQGLLNILDIPYTHSGVTASAIAMDKVLSGKLFETAGIQIPPRLSLDETDIVTPKNYHGSYVIKPRNDGSSVGVEIVLDGRICSRGLWDSKCQLIAEQYIAGRELTVSVLNGKALCVTEIVSNTEFYNYTAKYKAGGSHHIIPADIPEKCTQIAMDWSEAAFNLLGCRGVARADFRWNEANESLYMLEINTQPGMTKTSLVPEQASFCNIQMHSLINLLVEVAQCD